MKNGEGTGRDLYVQLGTTAESRAAARVQVVVVDERGELAVDGVLDRRVHGTVDVSRELGDQPGLDFGPEPLCFQLILCSVGRQVWSAASPENPWTAFAVLTRRTVPVINGPGGAGPRRVARHRRDSHETRIHRYYTSR